MLVDNRKVRCDYYFFGFYSAMRRCDILAVKFAERGVFKDVESMNNG